MTRPFRFAVQGGPFTDPDGLRVHARIVEDLGYEELYSSDHVGYVDPFLPLLTAAEATTTLRFGPLVLNNEFHNPVLLARTAATFDVLTGGRLVLGMGTGYMASEHEASGIALRDPAPRVTRFDESLTVLRSLLDDGVCAFDGQHVHVNIDDLEVHPAQPHVPILVGGHGRRVVTLAAKHADIFQFTGLTHAPVTGEPSAGGFSLDDIAQRHRWLVDAAGARLDSIELSALVQVTNLTDAADDAADGMASRIGADRSLIDETPFAMFGPVDAVVEKLLSLRERFGMSHFVVREPETFAPVVARLAGT